MLLCLSLLCAIPAATFSQDSAACEPDIAYRKTIELEIKGNKGDDFELTSNVTVDIEYLSERSAAHNEYYIARSYWEKVDKVKAVRGGEKLKKSRIEQLYPQYEDTFNSELKFYRISFPEDLRAGDSVSYSYRKKYRDIALLPIISIPNTNRLEELTVIVKHPKGVSVEPVPFFPREKIPLSTELISERETRISVGPIDYFEGLPYYVFNDVHGCFCLKLMWGDEAITPLSTEDFVEWYQQLVDLKPIVPDSVVSALELDFSSSETTIDSLAVINDFVRHNVRYIADNEDPHSIVPHSAFEVLARLYGDCKDRANLVSALARACGISVSMAFSTAIPYVTMDAVHPALFDHVICCYEGGQTPLFFDPTARFLTIGTLPEYLIGQKALILNPRRPRFIEIEDDELPPKLEMRIDGHIDSLKNCRASIILRSEPMVLALWARSGRSGFALQVALSEIVSAPLYRVSLDSLQVDSVAYDKLFLTGLADLSEFIIDSGKKKYIPQAPFVVYGNALLGRENDSLPVHFENRVLVTLRLELVAPGLVAAPDSVQLESGARMRFEATIQSLESERVQLYYKLCQLDKHILSDSKETLTNFCRQYLNIRKDLFTLRERES